MALPDFASPSAFESPTRRLERERTRFQERAGARIEEDRRRREEEQQRELQRQMRQQAQAAARQQQQVASFRAGAMPRVAQAQQASQFRRQEAEDARLAFRNGAAQIVGNRPQPNLGPGREYAPGGGLQYTPEGREAIQRQQVDRVVSALPGVQQPDQRAGLLNPLLPESALNAIEDVPVVGSSARRFAAGLSSPAGIYATVPAALAFPAATAYGTAAALGGETLGRQIELGAERAGVDTTVDTPIGSVGPRSVLGVAGGLYGGPRRGLPTRGTGALDDVARVADAPTSAGIVDDVTRTVGDSAPVGEVAPLQRAKNAFRAWGERYKVGRRELEALRSEDRAARADAYAAKRDELMDAGMSFPEAGAEAERQFAGEYARLQLPGLDIDAEATTAFWKQVQDRSYDLGGEFTENRARRALVKILTPEAGELQPNEVKLLRKVLDQEDFDSLFAVHKALSGKAPSAVGALAEDAWKFLATVKSGLDFSIHFAQMAPTAVRNPNEFRKAFWADLRAFASERAAQSIDDGLRGDARIVRVRNPDGRVFEARFGEVADRLGGIYTTLDTEGDLIVSRAARYVPGVENSGRGFVAAGNKMRHDLLWKWTQRWSQDGVIDIKRLEDMGELVNRLTGRGNIEHLGGEKLGNLIRGVMWAPGLRLSVPQAFARVVAPNVDPAVRRIAAENLGSWLATGTGILLLADLTGAAQVTFKPNSSEFGKFRVGNVSYNVFGTNAVLARYLARAFTRQGETRYGVKFDVFPPKAIVDYVKSGLDPTLGLVLQVAHQKTYSGDPIDWDEHDIKQMIREQFPLGIQDIYGAYREGGAVQAAVGAPAALTGIQSSSYGEVEGTSAKLSGIPRWDIPGANITVNEIREIQDLRRDVAQWATDHVRKYGVAPGGEMATKLATVGAKNNYSSRVISLAQTLNSTNAERQYTNPEWLRFVAEHEPQLRQERPEMFSQFVNEYLHIREQGRSE